MRDQRQYSLTKFRVGQVLSADSRLPHIDHGYIPGSRNTTGLLFNSQRSILFCALFITFSWCMCIASINNCSLLSRCSLALMVDGKLPKLPHSTAEQACQIQLLHCSFSMYASRFVNKGGMCAHVVYLPEGRQELGICGLHKRSSKVLHQAVKSFRASLPHQHLHNLQPPVLTQPLHRVTLACLPLLLRCKGKAGPLQRQRNTPETTNKKIVVVRLTMRMRPA